ncbi:MAG: hypothetical protein KDI79_19210 [Anaerolineae bacterium]|nr:hypothetical protein [Anaerolineae bacterium]
METALTFTFIITRLNEALSSAIVIIAFSLFVYMFTYNLRSSIGRAFAILLACMCFAYAGDVALYKVTNIEDAIPWLKFQWIGIAFIPAAYLHFADVLLRATNAISPRRRFTVFLAYFFGFLILLLAIHTDYLVRDPFYSPGVTQFRSGPFFWIFTCYFYTTLLWGAYKVYRARARCLTSGARKRMTYLAISFVAPALGVYPYMLIANTPKLMPPVILFITLFLVNLGIAMMIIVMAYSVVFFGAMSPDRVIKHNLIHLLLRGSFVAAIVISIIQVLPEQQQILGLPRELILATSIVTVIVLSQLLINLLKPAIDSIIFYQDRNEIKWISELDRRLLTTSDLQQALENILIILCESLRVRTGFIYNLAANQGPRLEAYTGPIDDIEEAIANIDVNALIAQKNGSDGFHFIIQNNFWFVILKTQSRDRSLGLLGIEARAAEYDLTPDEEEITALLLDHAEQALEDRRLQQQIFTALRSIIPDIKRVQRLSSAVSYAGASNLNLLTEENPIHTPDFSKMVKDALSHYWGGPKLTQSPLLNLRVVQEAISENDGNQSKALRAVLEQAIEKQRPDGERQLTAAEWLIYNILELKFIQGMRVRDIAHRLAMSEADLYRKQRLAIEEVARTLSEMETQNGVTDMVQFQVSERKNSHDS